MLAASKAFLASPIGLVLAAAAGAIALLSAGFKKSQLLMDEVSVSAAGLSASFDVVIDRVSVGMEKAFKELKEDPKAAVIDLGETIKDRLVNVVKGTVDFFIGAFHAITEAIKGNRKEALAALDDVKTAYVQSFTGLDEEGQANKIRKVTDEMRSNKNEKTQ